MKTQRIRDPIHDIITFESRGLVDEGVWALLQTPELQRLRRIKQLGLSEFVFPSATHSRFAHSVGVFHNARRLFEVIEQKIRQKDVSVSFDEGRAKVALFAALLHDIGHGPFSHAFEEARNSIAKDRPTPEMFKPKFKKHEDFTAELILAPSGNIGTILEDSGVKAQDVANLVKAETPADMYHAVVSSSFDADRLDYLVRDRYMTGTGAGAIDIEWLMDNVRVADLNVSSDDDYLVSDGGDGSSQLGFCLGFKARDAAEDFLLARYRLYSNVYFHKTTRGIEQLMSAFFRFVAAQVADSQRIVGLPDDHALVQFFLPQGDDIDRYSALDDHCVWGALQAVAINGTGELRQIAARVLNREKPHCLDIQNAFPDDFERQRRLMHYLNKKFAEKIHRTVFRDLAGLSLYGPVRADDTRAQKRLMTQMNDRNLKEITDLADATVAASNHTRRFDRYYFLDEADAQMAQKSVEAIRRGKP